VQEELELSRLVPALGEPRQVVPLDAQFEAQRRSEARQRLDRRRRRGERDARREHGSHRFQRTGLVARGPTKKTRPGLRGPGLPCSAIAGGGYWQACVQYPGTHWYPFQNGFTQ